MTDYFALRAWDRGDRLPWQAKANAAEAARGNPYPRRARRLPRHLCMPSELGLEGYA